jgi:hypothetical protein
MLNRNNLIIKTKWKNERISLIRKIRKYGNATPEIVEIFDFFTISRMLEKHIQSKIVCLSA